VQPASAFDFRILAHSQLRLLPPWQERNIRQPITGRVDSLAQIVTVPIWYSLAACPTTRLIRNHLVKLVAPRMGHRTSLRFLPYTWIHSSLDILLPGQCPLSQSPLMDLFNFALSKWETSWHRSQTHEYYPWQTVQTYSRHWARATPQAQVIFSTCRRCFLWNPSVSFIRDLYRYLKTRYHNLTATISVWLLINGM
jgi:hypothetical protein